MNARNIFYPGTLFLSIALMFASCGSKKPTENKQNVDKKDSAQAQVFNPISFSYTTNTLILPEGFSYQILFSEGDTVFNKDGIKAPAKGKHDFVAFIPIENDPKHGYLYVSHESRVKDAALGDGGGGTVIELKWENDTWVQVENKRNVEFGNVGFTINNCGGTVTPKGLVLTAEEMAPIATNDIHKYFSSIAFYDDKPYHENFGWMVLVDPISGEAIKKVKNFGRYVHEDAHCTKDGKTVYLTDDYCPAVFFKFECEEPNNYDKGQLYAYQQSEDGEGGVWLEIPMDYESLKDARNVAIGLGATMFVRQEWVDGANGKIYITETGTDDFDLNEFVEAGGTIPSYLKAMEYESGKFNDPYGRVLEFDPTTNKMSPFIEGGALKDGGIFSNPDGLHVTEINDITYLIINEDKIGLDKDRVNQNALDKGEMYNNIYFFDMTKEPNRDNLMRFAVGPMGSETTGSWYNQVTKTYFFSVQSPDKGNPEPFNKSCTIAVTGFK